MVLSEYWTQVMKETVSKDISVEIAKSEKQSEQILKTKHSRLWDNFKRYNIHIM